MGALAGGREFPGGFLAEPRGPASRPRYGPRHLGSLPGKYGVSIARPRASRDGGPRGPAGPHSRAWPVFRGGDGEMSIFLLRDGRLAEVRGRLEALLQEVRTMVRATDGLFDLGGSV